MKGVFLFFLTSQLNSDMRLYFLDRYGEKPIAFIATPTAQSDEAGIRVEPGVNIFVGSHIKEVLFKMNDQLSFLAIPETVPAFVLMGEPADQAFMLIPLKNGFHLFIPERVGKLFFIRL